jgi:hypothetical protein
MTDQTTGADPDENPAAPRRTLHATREEAEAAKPAGVKVRLFEVRKDGRPHGFARGQGGYETLIAAARHDGRSARVADPKGGAVTKERVAARLAEFTDVELAAMGLSRKKSNKKQQTANKSTGFSGAH